MKILFTFALALSLLYVPLYAQTNTSCPCCSAEHRQFDFWVGHWKVYNARGQLSGTNTIEKIQGDCVLRENWTSANPSVTGTSYNFYNKVSDRWEQIWIDNSGASLHLKGKRVANQMVMKTELMRNKNNEEYYNQISWTKNEDGTVRQLWQVFTEGQEPQVVFDGLYRPNSDE